MSKKIAFDAKRLFHNFRGLGNYGRTLVNGLCEYYPENQYELYTPHFKDPRTVEYIKFCESRNIAIKTPITLLGKIFPSLWRTRTITNDIVKNPPDIFHGLTHELPYGLEIYKEIKKIVTIHDLIFLRYPQFFPLIDRMIYKKKFQYACESADIVLAICEQTKNDLIEFLNVPSEKIMTHYQACDSHFYETFSDAQKKEIKKKYNLPEKFILFVGALEERKNVNNLIEAFSSFKTSDVDLVLVGSGPLLEKLKSKCESLNIQDKVIFLDKVSFKDLPGVYQQAKVFCYPSFFEGFGIPIVEALFSGVPVVTSSGSCFPESGGDAARYINPYRVEDIADTLNEILNHSSLCSDMIQKGFNYVQKFHIKTTTQKLAEIYDLSMAI